MPNKIISKIAFVASGGVALLALGAMYAPNIIDGASATDASKDVPVNVNVDPIISITVPDNFAMNVTPKGTNPDFVKASGTVSVSTNNVTGYHLLLSMADGAESTDLNHTLDPVNYQIPSVTGATATTSDDLINHWGYSTESPSSITTLQPLPGFDTETHKPISITLKNIDHVPATSAETDTSFTTGTRINTTMPSGTYSNTIKFTAVTNEIPITWDTMTEMQQMTPEICASQPTPAATDTAVPTKTLTDTRDGTTYTISKLADGNCWMTDNLALELNTSQTLTNENTDLNSVSSWTPERSTGAAWSDSPSHPYSLIPSGAPAGAGAYYNWTAAVASNDTSSSTTSGTKMPDSICPKGWQLPIMDGTTSTATNQLANLWTQYGWSSSSYSMDPAVLFGSPLNYVLAGHVDSGSLNNVGSSGYLWSPVVYSSVNAYYGYFYSDGNARPDNFGGRNYGQSVRCVAR